MNVDKMFLHLFGILSMSSWDILKFWSFGHAVHRKVVPPFVLWSKSKAKRYITNLLRLDICFHPKNMLFWGYRNLYWFRVQKAKKPISESDSSY